MTYTPKTWFFGELFATSGCDTYLENFRRNYRISRYVRNWMMLSRVWWALAHISCTLLLNIGEWKMKMNICNVHMQALHRKLDVVLVRILPYNCSMWNITYHNWLHPSHRDSSENRHRTKILECRGRLFHSETGGQDMLQHKNTLIADCNALFLAAVMLTQTKHNVCFLITVTVSTAKPFSLAVRYIK